MNRVLLHGMYDELEKISGLYDPDIHNTPEARARLRRMEDLQLRHRMRTSGVPVTEYGLRDVPGLVKEQPGRAKFMGGGGYWTETRPGGSFFKPEMEARVYAPRGAAQAIAPNVGGMSPAARAAQNVTMHHELDEVGAARRKFRANDPSQFTWGPSSAEKSVQAVPKKARGAARRAYRAGVSRLPQGVQDFLQAGAQAPSPITAMHMDPSVLIQESNRVARLDPESRAKLMKMRQRTREAGLMQRHGLRYGQEVIPESGRRFEKLRGAMQQASDKTMGAQRDLMQMSASGGEKMRTGVQRGIQKAKAMGPKGLGKRMVTGLRKAPGALRRLVLRR